MVVAVVVLRRTRVSSCGDTGGETDIVLFVLVGLGCKVGTVNEAMPFMKDRADEWFG